jgi:hypothetical protein
MSTQNQHSPEQPCTAVAILTYQKVLICIHLLICSGEIKLLKKYKSLSAIHPANVGKKTI